MKTTVIFNQNKTHIEIIRKGFDSAESITIYVAFMKISGLSLIKDSLVKAIKKGATVNIVVGLDFFITEPKALSELSNICSTSKKAQLMLFEQDYATFHPKLYSWNKNSITTTLVGSANLTGGGLSSNYELSILHESKIGGSFNVEIDSMIKRIKSDYRLVPATAMSLSQYERKFVVYTNQRKRAERDAAEEISQFNIYNERDLRNYLSEYRASREEKGDFKTRVSNYRIAKRLLDSLVDNKIPSKRSFLKIYEQLVGSKDSGRLWHSSGLFRSKNIVANNYRLFIVMLEKLRNKMGKSPSKIFAIGLKHAGSIDGVGVNVITEILNTYQPKKYSVLNRNPVRSLAHLGFEEFKSLSKIDFTPEKYARFNMIISELGEICEIKQLSEVDHFLNYVYWKYAKPDEKNRL